MIAIGTAQTVGDLINRETIDRDALQQSDWTQTTG